MVGLPSTSGISDTVVRVAHLTRIDDVGDPRIADYRALRDQDLRKRYENEAGVFIAEGPSPVAELVRSRFPVRSLLIAEQRLGDVGHLLADLDAPVYVADRALIDAAVRFKLVQGVVGCGQRMPDLSAAEVVDGASTVAILEGVQDPENLGAMFRNAAGLGVDGVLLGPGGCDPLYRRCVRVSMGHVLHVPYAPVDVATAVDLVRAAGFRVLALTPAADGLDLREVPVGPRTAVLLGAEGPGLTDEVMAEADARVRIPMHNGVDSLNVSTAAAIAFHHLSRRS